MSERIGIGVVGAGSIGVRGALEHLCLPDVQDRLYLAAVCDPVEGRAQAAAEKYGVLKAYQELDELLADPNVGAVTLATPIGLHYAQGLAAIEAGKHVHFNKTMATTAREAQHLIDAAKAHDVQIVASPGQMTRPHNQELRRLLQSGGLGQLLWAMVGCAFGNYHETESVRSGEDVLTNANPSWYWQKPGGGPVYDMTVYGLHTLTGILGPARRVTGMSGIAIPERSFRGETYQVGADDNTFALLDFGNSLFAFVYGSAGGNVTPEFGQPLFFGTKGTCTGSLINGKPFPFPGSEEKLEHHQRGPHLNSAHRDMEECHVFEDIMQLVDAARDGTPVFGTAEHACHVIEIIEAIYRASETGQTQELQTTFTPLDFN